MRRKIIKQKSAYTITLPVKWVRSFGVDKLSELDVEENGETLVLSSGLKSSPKKIAVLLEKNEEQYCRIMLESHYLSGFDIVDVTFTDKKTMSIIREIVANLIGIEIVHQEELSCIISQTAMPTDDEFKSLINRSISIITYTLQLVEEGLKKNTFELLDEIEQLTKDARRFLLFLTRIIHKQAVVDISDESFMHLLLERLILIQHNQLYLYRKLSSSNSGAVSKEVLSQFIKSKNSFSDFLFQLNKQNMKNFVKISESWTEIYFNHDLFVGCSKNDSIVLYHSMFLAKLVFLIAQPNQTRQFKYILN